MLMALSLLSVWVKIAAEWFLHKTYIIEDEKDLGLYRFEVSASALA